MTSAQRPLTIYEFGDVILVPFPFTNQTSSKKRLTVIISSNAYNQQRSDLIVIAITSQVSAIIQFGEMVITDWSFAGLLKSSIIKPVVTTIEKSLVIKKLGKLQASDRQSLKNMLQIILEN